MVDTGAWRTVKRDNSLRGTGSKVREVFVVADFACKLDAVRARSIADRLRTADDPEQAILAALEAMEC